MDEIKTEKVKVVKVGYEQFHAEATEKLANLEETVRAKVEELMKDDKERLVNIIEMCMEEVEVPVPTTTEEEVEEVVGE